MKSIQIKAKNRHLQVSKAGEGYVIIIKSLVPFAHVVTKRGITFLKFALKDETLQYLLNAISMVDEQADELEEGVCYAYKVKED